MNVIDLSIRDAIMDGILCESNAIESEETCCVGPNPDFIAADCLDGGDSNGGSEVGEFVPAEAPMIPFSEALLSADPECAVGRGIESSYDGNVEP
ncbi:hypothetical protein N8766_04060, partial [bacterium]|nr:hypothetical protein [bacterium]